MLHFLSIDNVFQTDGCLFSCAIGSVVRYNEKQFIQSPVLNIKSIMRIFFHTSFAALLLLIGNLAFCQDDPNANSVVDLNDANYQVWRDHILPGEKELGWDQIPWLTTFKDGIIAADKEKKPLLLWTMNGHPLGCT